MKVKDSSYRERFEKLGSTTLLERRMRADLIETFKMIDIISNHVRHFSIFLLVQEIYCVNSFHKVYEPIGFFLFIEEYIIQTRRSRHAGHCWRSKDEIVSDVLLCTSAYGQSKAGRPARTFIQQLCDDTGCNPEDLPEAMNDRETWRERVWDIRTSRTT